MRRWSVPLRPLVVTLALGFGLLAVLFVSVGCWSTQSRPPVVGPGPGPSNPPRTWTLQIDVTTSEGVALEGAAVRVYTTDPSQNAATGVTDAAGHHFWLALPQAGYSACAAKLPEYPEVCVGVNLVESRDGNHPVRIALTRATPAVTTRGRLRVQGRQMLDGTGQAFTYRALMGFALVDVFSEREQDARAFLRWARDTGFEVVRVLASNHGWMNLTPEDGRRVLPRFLAVAGEHGLYVQVVAVAGSTVLFPTKDAIRAQVKAIGAICAEAANCILEIANEPYHPSQADALYSPTFMRELRALVPAQVPVTYGAPEKDEPLASAPTVEGVKKDGRFMSGGDFVVLHRGRRDFAQRWDNVRRIRELAGVAESTGKFTVDNEPTGAAETNQGSSRYNDPAYFFAQGALSRLFEVAGNFHCSDCLFARVPGPIQRASAEAFIAGTRIVPDSTRLRYVNTGHVSQGSPASGADFTKVTRVYFGLGSPSIGIAVGLKPGVSDPGVQWANGYRRVRVIDERRSADGSGVSVWEVAN